MVGNMSDLSYEAILFAVKAHAGQTRKLNGEPYVMHPLRVARTVWEWCGDKDMQTAALLHDVVEDTSITLDEIRERFGPEVAGLVGELTKGNFTGNRKERVSAEIERLRKISLDAKSIKVADIQDNIRDIEMANLDYAEMYLSEKLATMQVIKPATFFRMMLWNDLMSLLESKLMEVRMKRN